MKRRVADYLVSTPVLILVISGLVIAPLRGLDTFLSVLDIVLTLLILQGQRRYEEALRIKTDEIDEILGGQAVGAEEWVDPSKPSKSSPKPPSSAT